MGEKPKNPPVGTDDFTLRDWFAGQALAGFSADSSLRAIRGCTEAENIQRIAQAAYEMADAMLDQR